MRRIYFWTVEALALVIMCLMVQSFSYGQDTSFRGCLKNFVLDYSRELSVSDFNLDSIATFSYVVVFDENSKFDTVLVSPLLDSLAFKKGNVERLANSYRKLDTCQLDLADAAIFVPVLIMPIDDMYNVFMDDQARSQAFEAFQNLFSVLDFLSKNGKVKRIYTVPISVVAN